MSDTYVSENLSFTDAFFLYLEQPGAPLNVASISAFEGEIPLDVCMEYVESKLPLIPRFLQRIESAPFSIGPPTWRFDPHFDVRNHVREISLKRGTETEWKVAVSDVLSTNLCRNRPLWDITLFRGLKGGRTGVVVRTHHCLVDGVAGVGLLRVLLDPNPIAPPATKTKTARPKMPPPRDPGTALLDGLISSCFSAAQALLTAHSELLRMAEQGSRPNGKGTHEDAHAEVPGGPLSYMAPLGNLARLLTELAQPTERLPFNTLCHGPQKFDWTAVSMAELIAVKEACGATLNEVVLTVLTSALQKYAELHNLKVKGRRLRLVVPVDIRCDGEESGTGNHITFLPVDITLGRRDPRKLLSDVQHRVGFSRTAHAAELVTLAGLVVSALPPALQSMAGSFLSQLPISVCNTICTNVHGPKTPLYLLGHKMLSIYPYVPIGGEMGMNCAVMSYDGSLFVGFTGDSHAIPDLSRLSTLFSESFVELRNSVGGPVAKPKRARPKAKPPSRKVTEPVPIDSIPVPTETESAAVAVSA